MQSSSSSIANATRDAAGSSSTPTALQDTARELQSDLRRLDRTLKEVESEAKKLEKHVHSLESHRDAPSDEREYGADVACDQRSLARAVKLVAVMRSLAESQVSGVDRILHDIATLERVALARPKPSATGVAVSVLSNNLPSANANTTTATNVGPLRSAGVPIAVGAAVPANAAKLARPKRDAAAISSPNAVPSSVSHDASAAAYAAAAADPDAAHAAKKARPHVGQKGMPSAEAPPREGELVAARDARNDSYLLARVLQYLPTKQKYNVEDADPTLESEMGRRTFQCGLNEIVALRKPDNEYRVDVRVYAMFPETSTFYIAKVIEPPSVNVHSHYLVRFEDDEDDSGDTPHREIDPRYVVLYRNPNNNNNNNNANANANAQATTK
jgi:hypothetical protein